ncbi:amidohydrolase [Aurantiacibacter xanthus]|uniref:Amidohydrolase n=1 Tax=Aurantiacibacter xanthus TaxID=1784712 RepID=A0A3A1P1P1_9SPHN|nr:amidohydrolase [Aurantiacibacter xanthus]RIV83202.1 amidohydrolase [Aurantiacibacter xanthus]
MKRLLLASAIALALAPSPALADTLFENVDGISITPEGKVKRFAAMVVNDEGRITELLDFGDGPEGKVDYLEDMKGAHVVPGFIDSHAHVMGLGLGTMTLDLSQTRSLEEALALIADYAAKYPERPWLLGHGWNQEQWGLGRYPTAAELDAVVGDRPVWLSRIDGHAGWANSAALAAAEITAQTRDPAGGRILRLGNGRQPAGVLIDAAMAPVDQAVPPPLPEDREQALFAAQKIFFEHGITAVADMGTSLADWMSYRRAGDAGWLQMRIMAYAGDLEEMLLIGGTGPTLWLYDDKLRMGGIKVWLDGALGSRGARLKTGYADDPANLGIDVTSGTQLRNIMSRAALDDFQVAIHAIGDAANDEALAAIDELAAEYPGERRWRIEHAQIVDPADIARFGQHGVIASMQPVHMASDRLMAEVRVGPDRLAGAYAWRSLADAGALLAFGSDAPVEPVDVLAGLATAISRQDAAGEPAGGWMPEQRVTREQALAAYTAAGAYAGYAEGRFGSLQVGERADFVVLDNDPLLTSPEELRTTRVLQTWVAGRRVFPAQ